MFKDTDWDLLFVCQCIEYISRQNSIQKSAIVNLIGRDGISNLLYRADVDHCEDIQNTVDRIVEEYQIPKGDYVYLTKADYQVPRESIMGKRYCYVINDLFEDRLEGLMTVYNTEWFCSGLDDYNMYYFWQSDNYVEDSFSEGKWQ